MLAVCGLLLRVNNMADHAWKNFKTQMKNKRTSKGKGKASKCFFSTGELTIQRLSSSVSGKAQKYSRIGPREFVAFTHEELTVANIKSACHKYFASSIGSDMVCDVLAGDQGPSCRSVDQIPDTKVIHVRFIESVEVDAMEDEDAGPKHKKTRKGSPLKSLPALSGFSRERPQKSYYPKSLSISKMLKLGKTIEETSTSIELFSFNMAEMLWPTCGERADFSMAKNPFASGGFREAYKASSNSIRFKGNEWVVKKYLPETLTVIGEINETVESHTKKVVQMHHLARNMTANLQMAVNEAKKEEEFGEMLRYNNIFLGKIDQDFVTVEEFIPGSFVKYINNTGQRCVEAENENGKKAECLSHFSFEKSEKTLMVVDIQGSGCNLYNPEIASIDLLDNGKVMFCVGNLSKTAIEGFTMDHQCNKYCQLVGLQKL